MSLSPKGLLFKNWPQRVHLTKIITSQFRRKNDSFSNLNWFKRLMLVKYLMNVRLTARTVLNGTENNRTAPFKTVRKSAAIK